MNIISLKKYRQLKEKDIEVRVYRAKIEKMEKTSLLEELLKYHEDFMKSPTDLMATLRGQQLMAVLEERAELNELKSLSQDFNRKLKTRLAAQLAPTSTKD